MALSFDKNFKKAVSAYQAQQWSKAADLCRQVLNAAPQHAACLHLLGTIQHQLGRPDEAEELMRQAITLKPGFAEMHLGFAQVLTTLGKPTEAADQLRQATKANPAHANAWFLLGNTLKALEQHAEAAEAFARAVAADPRHAPALNNLGVTHFEKGETAAAMELYRRAIELNPSYAAALNNLGNAHKALEQWDEAIACYHRALAIKPDLLQAVNNLGLTLLYGKTDIRAAEKCFRAILAYNPDYVPALTHLGVVLCMQGAFAESIPHYQKALALSPGYRDALNNLGNALKAVGRVTEAIAALEQVVTAYPNEPEARNNLAMTKLLAGNFDEGWRDYEWRWQTLNLAAARRDFPQPQWQGEVGQGRTLLIHAEQGFGDTLQFCRYAPLAAQRGWRVVMEVQPELVRLLRSSFPAVEIMGRGEPLPPFDHHCPTMSLPAAFATQIATIPAAMPYLAAAPEAVENWQEKLALENGTALKVGLSWAGNPRLFSADLAMANMRRSLPFNALKPLAAINTARFYSLQKDAAIVPDIIDLIDEMPACQDFADTAALISGLDLVICVDTAVAHLAAALGKPVWLLNRYDTCWRWFTDRDDSPWYPSLRLFRQTTSGDWDGVIARVAVELRILTS